MGYLFWSGRRCGGKVCQVEMWSDVRITRKYMRKERRWGLFWKGVKLYDIRKVREVRTGDVGLRRKQKIQLSGNGRKM